MDKRLKSILKYGLSVGLAAILLYFSFRKVEWSSFRSSLAACKWGYVLLSMSFGILAFWLRGLRWRLLLLPVDPSTSRRTTFNAVNIGNVINMVLPRVGEVARCGYINKHSAEGENGHKKATVDKVLGTVLVDRMWDVVMMAIFLVGTLLLGWKRYGAFFNEKILSSSEGGGPGFSTWMLTALIALALFLFVVYLLRRRSRICARICSFFKGIWLGIKDSFKTDKGIEVVILSLLVWCAYLLTTAAVLWAARGTGYERVMTMDLFDAMFLMIAGALSSLIPVPGGFGAFHYVVATAITTVYGIPFEVGIIFATLSHESQAIAQIIAGAASYVDETLRKP